MSGFYGSGKSSFAKLLGLALDGRQLPDGTPLADVLLRRDDSPRGGEFREAWYALRKEIDPIAVVFDIGGTARDNEHIHATVVRQVQTRLGYCATSNLVADHELKLERDGEWGHLHGLVWLLATGQEKLEDTTEASPIGKLKERFPQRLRVHLAVTNIRDVVHHRLLKKAPAHEKLLRELFQKHRTDLKLHGYGCTDITEEDFVEVYPMLPGHVDLLLQITSSMRSRSTRIQGDDHAIRGLLQLLGELFRAQKLAAREVGDLVTLDAV